MWEAESLHPSNNRLFYPLEMCVWATVIYHSEQRVEPHRPVSLVSIAATLPLIYNLVTDHSNTWYRSVFPGYVPNILSPPGASCSLALTSTRAPASAKTPSHISRQLSGEWQFMRVPSAGHHSPFSARPPCTPRSIEPGRGESSPARRRATCSCCSNLNRWKNAPVKIAERCPCSSLRVRTDESGGAGLGGVAHEGSGGARVRKEVSRMSPSRKGTGKVAGVERKSSCPRSQRSAQEAWR